MSKPFYSSNFLPVLKKVSHSIPRPATCLRSKQSPPAANHFLFLMVRALLRSTLMSRATSLSSSLSSVAAKNPISSFTTRVSTFPNVFFPPRFHRLSLRSYAAASAFDRVRVLNPIVEMDGNCYFPLKLRYVFFFINLAPLC